MGGITTETLRVSPYAPVAINAYGYNGVEGMTFPQLLMAVCCRRASIIENQSVLKMNELDSTTAFLSAVSSVGEQLFTAGSLDETADIAGSGYRCRKTSSQQPTLREFLEKECGIDAQYISIASPDARTTLFTQLKPQIDSAASQSQQQTIDLQSLVSRRDVTYNISAATIKTLMQSALGVAAAIG